jgi:hypothetical protein
MQEPTDDTDIRVIVFDFHRTLVTFSYQSAHKANLPRIVRDVCFEDADWLVDFMVRARKAGIILAIATRAAGRYDYISQKNIGEIQKRESGECCLSEEELAAYRDDEYVGGKRLIKIALDTLFAGNSSLRKQIIPNDLIITQEWPPYAPGAGDKITHMEKIRAIVNRKYLLQGQPEVREDQMVLVDDEKKNLGFAKEGHRFKYIWVSNVPGARSLTFSNLFWTLLTKPVPNMLFSDVGIARLDYRIYKDEESLSLAPRYRISKDKTTIEDTRKQKVVYSTASALAVGPKNPLYAEDFTPSDYEETGPEVKRRPSSDTQFFINEFLTPHSQAFKESDRHRAIRNDPTLIRELDIPDLEFLRERLWEKIVILQQFNYDRQIAQELFRLCERKKARLMPGYDNEIYAYFTTAHFTFDFIRHVLTNFKAFGEYTELFELSLASTLVALIENDIYSSCVEILLSLAQQNAPQIYENIFLTYLFQKLVPATVQRIKYRTEILEILIKRSASMVCGTTFPAMIDLLWLIPAPLIGSTTNILESQFVALVTFGLARCLEHEFEFEAIRKFVIRLDSFSLFDTTSCYVALRECLAARGKFEYSSLESLLSDIAGKQLPHKQVNRLVSVFMWMVHPEQHMSDMCDMLSMPNSLDAAFYVLTNKDGRVKRSFEQDPEYIYQYCAKLSTANVSRSASLHMRLDSSKMHPELLKIVYVRWLRRWAREKSTEIQLADMAHRYLFEREQMAGNKHILLKSTAHYEYETDLSIFDQLVETLIRRNKIETLAKFLSLFSKVSRVTRLGDGFFQYFSRIIIELYSWYRDKFSVESMLPGSPTLFDALFSVTDIPLTEQVVEDVLAIMSRQAMIKPDELIYPALAKKFLAVDPVYQLYVRRESESETDERLRSLVAPIVSPATSSPFQCINASPQFVNNLTVISCTTMSRLDFELIAEEFCRIATLGKKKWANTCPIISGKAGYIEKIIRMTAARANNVAPAGSLLGPRLEHELVILFKGFLVSACSVSDADFKAVAVHTSHRDTIQKTLVAIRDLLAAASNKFDYNKWTAATTRVQTTWLSVIDSVFKAKRSESHITEAEMIGLCAEFKRSMNDFAAHITDIVEAVK